MRQRLNKQGKKTKALALVGLAAIAIVIIWMVLSKSLETGFGEYTTKTTEETDKTIGKVVKTTKEIQSPKTLWDILQLVVVPAALVYGGYWLNQREKKRAEENLREETLQAYLDRISELLTDKELGNQILKDNPARVVARARTLTVLRSLSGDGQRKEAILRFLYEANLIQGEWSIISLRGADLSKAILRGVDLAGAVQSHPTKRVIYLSGAIHPDVDLSGADLREADLREAILWGANLSRANLSRANLRDANLRDANLKGADLREADLSGADLREATYNDSTNNDPTKFPDGFDPVKAGMRKKSLNTVTPAEGPPLETS